MRGRFYDTAGLHTAQPAVHTSTATPTSSSPAFRVWPWRRLPNTISNDRTSRTRQNSRHTHSSPGGDVVD